MSNHILTPDEAVKFQIGHNVKMLREARQMTNGELSIATGVSRSLITLIEQGKRYPSIAVLLQLKLALDTSWDKLLEGIESL